MKGDLYLPLTELLRDLHLYFCSKCPRLDMQKYETYKFLNAIFL